MGLGLGDGRHAVRLVRAAMRLGTLTVTLILTLALTLILTLTLTLALALALTLTLTLTWLRLESLAIVTLCGREVAPGDKGRYLGDMEIDMGDIGR